MENLERPALLDGADGCGRPQPPHAGTGLVGCRPDPRRWRGVRVLVTGHTGFKGGWLTVWLREMGAEVIGLALPPEPGPSFFDIARVADACEHHICDLTDQARTAEIIAAAKPDVALHLAAQALVPRGLEDPVGTFAVNVGGTAHLLDALHKVDGLRATLVATSDKVYANDGSGRAFVETDPLGGKDPYSASKAACEHVVGAYRESLFSRRGVALATARGGNVIGGGDFAPGRLAPDCVRAALFGATVTLRSPHATRPWQHVLDCLCGYLLFAEALMTDPTAPAALNFGPAEPEGVTVQELTDALLSSLGAESPPHVAEDHDSVEAPRLALDASRARELLGIVERFSGRAAIEETARWTADWRAGRDMAARSRADIRAYAGMETAT